MILTLRVIRRYCFVVMLLVSPTASADGHDFRSGFATVAIETGETTSIGGYGHGDRRQNPFSWRNLFRFDLRLFQAGKEALGSVRIKAAVFLQGEKKLAWISVDSVGITHDFYRSVYARLKEAGYDEDGIFISATHTHSGPGNLSSNFFWQVAAMDWFRPSFYESVLGSIESAVRTAERLAVPADLLKLVVATQGLQKNRRQLGAMVDPTARLLLVRERGVKSTPAASQRWVGAIVNFAIHGTAHGPDNLHFSADVPGAIESEIEQLLDIPAALFVNAAEGDVAPNESGPAGVQRIGSEFARQVGSRIEMAEKIEPKWSVSSVRVELPPATLSIKKCTDFSAPEEVGFSADALTQIFGIGSRARVPLRAWISNQVKIWRIQLGSLSILTWPGEPTSRLGSQLAEIGKKKGWDDVWIYSLTNDYHAYFTTPDEFEENTYESCFSLHGGGGGEAILEGFKGL